MSEVLKDHTISAFHNLFPWEVEQADGDFITRFTVHSSKGVTILRATLEDVNGLDFEEFEWELREK
jgi:hypothetical protein